MAWLFSKRCQQALRDKKIKVSIPVSVRVRIWKALENYNESFGESTDYGNRETSTLQQLPESEKKMFPFLIVPMAVYNDNSASG